jgi:hypothetical protein
MTIDARFSEDDAVVNPYLSEIIAQPLMYMGAIAELLTTSPINQRM